jgi:hypothetical protein
LRESAWQGRSGGLDIEQRPDNTLYSSVDFKSKKINQRTPLPPLVDEINANNRVSAIFSTLFLKDSTYLSLILAGEFTCPWAFCAGFKVRKATG